MQCQNYNILRVYLGSTPFQRLSLPTTVKCGATTGLYTKFIEAEREHKYGKPQVSPPFSGP